MAAPTCWHELIANLNLNCLRAAWPEAAWIELKCNKNSHRYKGEGAAAYIA